MEELLVLRFRRLFAREDPASDVLRRGASGPCCVNLRHALSFLGIRVETGNRDDYDEGLECAVREFQTKFGHPVQDGVVGPGTRRRIVRNLVVRHGPTIFARLQDPTADDRPTVFVSYSTADSAVVDKVEAWLRDHDVRVLRYTHSFQGGRDIAEAARAAIAVADKVLLFHSSKSASADWVRSEIATTEELELQLDAGKRLIVYLRLDDTPLPPHDTNRIAIATAGRTLREIGNDLLHALADQTWDPPTVRYDEDAPLT